LNSYGDKEIELTTNDDVQIYIATDYNFPKLVGNDWMDTEEYLSILKVIIPKSERKSNIIQAK